MTIRSGGRPRDQRPPHARRYEADAYATDYVPEDFEPSRRYGPGGGNGRRRGGGGSGIGGVGQVPAVRAACWAGSSSSWR